MTIGEREAADLARGQQFIAEALPVTEPEKLPKAELVIHIGEFHGARRIVTQLRVRAKWTMAELIACHRELHEKLAIDATDAIEQYPSVIIDAINDEIRHFPLPLRGREHKGHRAVLAVHRVGLGAVGELYADGFWDNEGTIAYGQTLKDAMSGVRITPDELRALYGVVLERRAQRGRDDVKGGSGLQRGR